ncbi:stage V sporulation protein AC [Anaeromicropila populeti]|uniref:Stage V sporulation protein AC n=1 Tax=Anaeromicropila populeti TaxID=37658 RepID=A0A1I6JQT9_9FIRM|nr:stage V sporulation protein AC [Anaeromicropila populeti]SFR81298.1 stage V sporulation protein AC [Anaeromicropila populeti]
MDKNKVSIHDVVSEKDSEKREQKYNKYVKDVTPTHNYVLNTLKAFFVGGIICTIGQGFTNLYMQMGLDKETAGLYQIITLVLLSVVLTGLNIYSKLAKFGGAGTVVPITGFANSVAAAAIEFKTEGQVFGIGCKIFTICGPVILYGIFSSWVLGLVYYFLKMAGIV